MRSGFAVSFRYFSLDGGSKKRFHHTMIRFFSLGPQIYVPNKYEIFSLSLYLYVCMCVCFKSLHGITHKHNESEHYYYYY